MTPQWNLHTYCNYRKLYKVSGQAANLKQPLFWADIQQGESLFVAFPHFLYSTIVCCQF